MAHSFEAKRSSRAEASRVALFWRTLLGGVFPGALAGTHLAGLLFFLNPYIPFDPPLLGAAILVYGGALAAVGFLVLAAWVRGRLDRLWNVLPASLTSVLILSAALYWTHAYTFGYYLPPGINTRLLKAAVSLSVGALVCFYTVILHRLRRRPYGRRSRLLFTVMALLSIYVVVERREAYRPRLEPAPRASAFEGEPRPLVCAVGIDSATLDAVLPLAEQGQLPFFSSMLTEGFVARLGSLEPIRRVPLWTTLATGRFPYRHGVVGNRLYPAPFLPEDDHQLRLLPIGIGFENWGLSRRGRPVDRRDLDAPPLWRIVSRLGTRSAVVGWPATDPPEADIAFQITDRFFVEARPELSAQSVVPTSLVERARLFGTPLEEIDPATVSRFGQSPDREVLNALRGDLWRQDLAFFLLTDPEPSVGAVFVSLPGLGAMSRRHFGGWAAVQFEGVRDEASLASSRLISAYYAQLDDFLAELWETMREPKVLAVFSAHGTHGSEGWREAVRLLTRRPARRGYAGGDGLWLMRGEGIRAGSTVRGADLIDVAPTLLYGLGLPIARDLDGRVITDAFDTNFLARRPLTFVPSYEAFSPTARSQDPD